MEVDQLRAELDQITQKIIGCVHDVSNVLGAGFLEKVYENAMVLELRKLGLDVVPQAAIRVYYDGQRVGEYNADLLVAELVIVELKATRALTQDHEAQLLNYLKATSYEVGLLLNFGPKSQMKRKVYDNERKGNLLWTRST